MRNSWKLPEDRLEVYDWEIPMCKRRLDELEEWQKFMQEEEEEEREEIEKEGKELREEEKYEENLGEALDF